jgi:hypothetical protein
VLPASTGRLAQGAPEAPAGTIFVLGTRGGYAVPPRKFTIYFGRGRDDVHVSVGEDDPYVSRVHGKLMCGGGDWWIRNHGRLPILLPGDALLLSGNDMPIPAGYTPLLIASSGRRSHLLEVHVAGTADPRRELAPDSWTRPPEVYDLGPAERLVLIALAQRYLRHERSPWPVPWNQVAKDLNRAAPAREWTEKAVEHIAARVRGRLAADHVNLVAGVPRREIADEPTDPALSHNLIQALLRSATLLPADLRLIDDPDED